MSTRALHGRGVSPGTVCAPVAHLAAPVLTSADDPVGTDVEAEAARIGAALAAVAADLSARADAAEGVSADVLRTTAAMAADRSLLKGSLAQLRAGAPTAHAVTQAAESVAAKLEALGGYMAERAADVRDVRARVVAELLGVPTPGLPAPGHPVVLAARDLAPADTAALPGSDVVALLTEEGGPTSHTAILARSLGIPAVVGCPGAMELPEGGTVLLDGATGRVLLEPSADERAAATAAGTPAGAATSGPGRTRDGRTVPLLANIGRPDDAAAAADSDGVGLFRTEFLFLDRREQPSRAEQAVAYRAVLDAMGDRPVVARTLDAGSDKPLAFLPVPPEENPALGLRGLRTAGLHPGALVEQLAALADAASAAGRALSVMAPMVATAEEAASFSAAARAAGLTSVGVMIEIPSAALRARELLEEVDFVSIGTNDLGQYVMAADRLSGALGELLDPWQPALLDLVASVGEAGRATGKPVGVCGEAAGDPLLAAVLVGLGATSLSMSPVLRPAVHAQLALLTGSDCAAMAAAARAARGPQGAREAALRVRDELLQAR